MAENCLRGILCSLLLFSSLKSGWPDCGNFRLAGNRLLWAGFVKVTNAVKYINRDKNRLGYILCDFFTNSSGQPALNAQSTYMCRYKHCNRTNEWQYSFAFLQCSRKRFLISSELPIKISHGEKRRNGRDSASSILTWLATHTYIDTCVVRIRPYREQGDGRLLVACGVSKWSSGFPDGVFGKNPIFGIFGKTLEFKIIAYCMAI
jgi:hypothetical protein